MSPAEATAIRIKSAYLTLISVKADFGPNQRVIYGVSESMAVSEAIERAKAAAAKLGISLNKKKKSKNNTRGGK